MYNTLFIQEQQPKRLSGYTPKCSSNITQYNPKGLSRKQMGLSAHAYKLLVKRGIKC